MFTDPFTSHPPRYFEDSAALDAAIADMPSDAVIELSVSDDSLLWTVAYRGPTGSCTHAAAARYRLLQA